MASTEEARGDDRAGQVVGRDRRPKPTPGQGKEQNQQQNLNPSLAFYCKSNMSFYSLYKKVRAVVIFLLSPQYVFYHRGF